MPDQAYKTFPYAMTSKGLVAKYARDRCPEQTFLNLDNLEERQSGALSSRLGRSAITTDGVNNTPLSELSIHTLGRLKSTAQVYRYAGAGAKVFRRAGDTNGAYTEVASGLSGQRFSMVTYRPDFNAKPFLYIADRNVMRKDDGTFGTLQQWGIFPPNRPAIAQVQQFSRTVIDEFGGAAHTYVNFTTTSNPSRVSTTLGTATTAGSIQTVTPASMAGIIPGMVLRIDSGGGAQEDVVVLSIAATTFTAFFANVHTGAHTVTSTFLQGSVAANTEARITQSGALNLNSVGGAEAEDEDTINIYLRISNSRNIEEIKIMFDVGAGTFTDDYYHKSVMAPAFQSVLDGVVPGLRGGSGRLFDRASGQIDLRVRGDVLGVEDFPVLNGGDLLPIDDLALPGLRPAELLAGQNVWSRIQIKRGDFLKVGLAGLPGKTWANVNAWRVQIKTNQNGSVTVGLDDFYLYGGNGPDVFAGVPYDYRITWYNALTGEESSPSVVMVGENFVSPKRQPVKITWTPPADTQITHARIYRRGGTLPSQWLHIRTDDGVAIAAGTFTDSFSDGEIASNRVLELDNDPPVSVTLPAPVNTTLGTAVTAGSAQTVTPASMANIFPDQVLFIDEGDNSESVVAISTTGTQFTAYFQRAHTSAARVYAVDRRGRPMHLAAVAFERGWVAGDPDNPNRLYYTKKQRVSSFGPQRHIEIGTPSDPIMAVIAPHRGQLFVATLSRWYRIIDAAIPYPLPTSSHIGLVASFGWTFVEGAIAYRSHDGIYVFTGENSTLLSDPIKWLLENKEPNAGPVPEEDPAQAAESIMAYHRSELFFGYVDKTATRRRLIGHRTNGTWRNDSVPASAMLREEDTETLVIARTNGMIYKDRFGDVDGEGFIGGVPQNSAIAFTLETPAYDQGAPHQQKNYGELIVDLDSGGQNVTLTLVSETGATLASLGTISASGRQLVSVSVNSGQGVLSESAGLRITGSVTSAVHCWGWQFKAAAEAEKRKSADTYKTDLGIASWKFMRDAFFVYSAPDPAGISFSVYIEDSPTAEFTFTLPQSSVRTSFRITFPATKFKIIRFVAQSAAEFQLYPESILRVKSVSGKGYQEVKFPEEGP